MFNEIIFQVGEGLDADKYVITSDKRVGAFSGLQSMNVYTDLFHYPANDHTYHEQIQNYLSINESTKDIRQGFITTWLQERTQSEFIMFTVRYDHLYLPTNSEFGNRNGITYQAYNDGDENRISYFAYYKADVVQHNNYTGENTIVSVGSSKSHIGVRGTGFTYMIDPQQVIADANIAPPAVPEYLHLTNVEVVLAAESTVPFQMRAFNVINDLVTRGEAYNIIDSITEYENSGSVLDDIALDTLFEKVVDLLKVEIFPNISLWLILSSVLGVLLLVWFVKLFAGG